MTLELRELIREIPNFPKEGIKFLDICPLLRNPKELKSVIDIFAEYAYSVNAELVAGIESRGFIIGTAVAQKTELGFIPIRKPGKLPGEILGVNYTLEYGNDRLEIQSDAFEQNTKVLIIDDLLATGGTARGAYDLVKEAGGIVAGIGFIIEIESLSGRLKLPNDLSIKSILTYS